MQNSLFAIQAEFKDDPKTLAQATSMATFSQFLGGTIALAVGQVAFANELAQKVVQYAPDAPLEIIRESPLAIWTDLPKEQIPLVIKGYVQALDVGTFSLFFSPRRRRRSR